MSFAPAFARRVVVAALMLGSQTAAFAQTPESSRPADGAQTRETRLLREDYESLRDVMVVSLEMVRNASELAKVDRHLVGAALTTSITQQLRAIGVQVVEPIAGTLDALNVPTLRVGISTKTNGTHVVYLVSLELSRLVWLSDLGRPPSSNLVTTVAQARTWRASSYGMSPSREASVIGETVTALVAAFCEARVRAHSDGG